VKPLLSNDHFSVDGTLVEAWASLKSFRTKNGSDEPPGPGRNGERNFHNETRSNQTHASTTDPDAKLYRKSSNVAAKLSYVGHALAMIERHDPGAERRLTLAADKGYDTRGFVAECRRMCVTPHVAAKVRHSAIDRRTTRHAAYVASQRRRKLIEEAFGWAKTIAGIAKVKVRGLARVRHCFTLAMTAYNLIRMPKLLGWGAA
jgi:DDE family transposase